jgi:acyl-CoA thioesterase
MEHFNKENIIKLLENDRFSAKNGITLISAEPGYATAQMEIQDYHLNGLDIIQGGAIFTLADFAFAAASNMKGNITVSISANISFFKIPTGTRLIAKASEVSTDKKLCGYNVDVFDDNHDLISHVYINGFTKVSKKDKE